MVSLKTLAKKEEGNALFLILIAVTLFAALSYAVTQSGRGSGTGATDDSNLIISSQVTQYPASLRSGVDRLLIRGWGASEILFITDTADGNYGDDVNLFNPNGLSGVIPQDPPQNAVIDVDTAEWVYNKDVALPEIGVDATADIVAILDGLKQNVCSMINEQIVGRDYFSTPDNVPELSGTVADWEATIAAGTITSSVAGDATKMEGKAFLCVENGDGNYVYYHALVEN